MPILCEYQTPELHLRHVVDEHPNDKYFSMHVHNHCEIFCYLSGNVKYLVEGYEYALEPGSIMLMRPSETHRARIVSDKTYERFSLNFYPEAIDSIDTEHRLMRAFIDRPLGCGNLYLPSELKGVQPRDFFENMCLPARDDYDRELKIHTQLFALLDIINEAYMRRADHEFQPPQTLAEQMVAYVNANLFDELSVPYLAKRFFISPSQVGRIFKKATGTAPWEYITIKRLSAVRERIHSGELAKEASLKCGFSDYSVFYRAYVKYFGCAPREDK